MNAASDGADLVKVITCSKTHPKVMVIQLT
jgi:hypothetical protein